MSDKATAASKTVAAHAPPKPAALATMTRDMLALQAHFGQAVIQPAPHEGVLVAAERLRDVAAFVRDELKYDMLTSETADRIRKIKTSVAPNSVSSQPRMGGFCRCCWKVATRSLSRRTTSRKNLSVK